MARRDIFKFLYLYPYFLHKAQINFTWSLNNHSIKALHTSFRCITFHGHYILSQISQIWDPLIL